VFGVPQIEILKFVEYIFTETVEKSQEWFSLWLSVSQEAVTGIILCDLSFNK
jgi:hypothetical protein